MMKTGTDILADLMVALNEGNPPACYAVAHYLRNGPELSLHYEGNKATAKVTSTFLPTDFAGPQVIIKASVARVGTPSPTVSSSGRPLLVADRTYHALDDVTAMLRWEELQGKKTYESPDPYSGPSDVRRMIQQLRVHPLSAQKEGTLLWIAHTAPPLDDDAWWHTFTADNTYIQVYEVPRQAVFDLIDSKEQTALHDPSIPLEISIIAGNLEFRFPGFDHIGSARPPHAGFHRPKLL